MFKRSNVNLKGFLVLVHNSEDTCGAATGHWKGAGVQSANVHFGEVLSLPVYKDINLYLASEAKKMCEVYPEGQSEATCYCRQSMDRIFRSMSSVSCSPPAAEYAPTRCRF